MCPKITFYSTRLDLEKHCTQILILRSMLQVWFQNRRAKFRRNERNMMAQRSSLYGRPAETTVEQPIAARPNPVNSDYLSWSTPSYAPVTNSTYNALPPNNLQAVLHSMPPVVDAMSCAMVGAPNYSSPAGVGPNPFGSSITSLRQKARDYNMHQQTYSIPHQMVWGSDAWRTRCRTGWSVIWRTPYRLGVRRVADQV